VFPESYLVTDRFHVVKLMKALQHLRIKYGRKLKENQAIKKVKKKA
jgi:hypothetical protein